VTEHCAVCQIWLIFSAIAITGLADEPAPRPFEITVQRAESGVDEFWLDGKKVLFGIVKLAQVCREQSPPGVNASITRVLENRNDWRPPGYGRRYVANFDAVGIAPNPRLDAGGTRHFQQCYWPGS
jgi:hypothetical protein